MTKKEQREKIVTITVHILSSFVPTGIVDDWGKLFERVVIILTKVLISETVGIVAGLEC